MKLNLIGFNLLLDERANKGKVALVDVDYR
jgi:hypothetical protein